MITISWEQLDEHIDKGDLKEWLNDEIQKDKQRQFEEDMEGRVRQIKALPSAEPEIIHCRDCENWDTTWQNDFAPNYHYCPLIDGTRRDDFYCADAERRTDG